MQRVSVCLSVLVKNKSRLIEIESQTAAFKKVSISNDGNTCIHMYKTSRLLLCTTNQQEICIP